MRKVVLSRTRSGRTFSSVMVSDDATVADPVSGLGFEATSAVAVTIPPEVDTKLAMASRLAPTVVPRRSVRPSPPPPPVRVKSLPLIDRACLVTRRERVRLLLDMLSVGIVLGCWIAVIWSVCS